MDLTKNRYSSQWRAENAPEKVLYEVGDFWVSKAKDGGFEVYKTGLTHSTRVAQIGYEGETGLQKAKAEADRRARAERK
jgi:hypothetical protein